MKSPFILIGLAAAVGFFSGCTTVNETGRSQLMLVSPAQEAQMGLSSFDQIKKAEKISTDPALNARIQRIGRRIAASVGREIPNAQWEFVVFDSPTVNAFALPGGKVGVYTGLIKLAASDDEIAIVMGHEVAHVTSRHGAERVSQNYAIAGVGMAAAIGMEVKNVDPAKRNMALAAYGLGSQVGVALPFSRLHETEADSVGLRFAAGAGYDPRAGATFWKKMAAQGGAKPPEFLSSHPADATRIANLQKLAPQYMPLYEQNKGRFGQ
ncbi:MAG: M48 family metallopeptidase [Opitutaceae bacterium]|nr:M48 family metallopeptidase [Opitutaceae bacterium]